MNAKSFPEIQASLVLYKEATARRTPPEWYPRLNPSALAVEQESGKKFEAAVRAVPEAVAAGAENIGELVTDSDAARREAWGKHYARRLDIAVRGLDMLQGTPASRYAMFHNGVGEAMKAAELAIGAAKVWDGADAEDEKAGLRPLVIEAEDRLREAWGAFKTAERWSLGVDRVFSPELTKILLALGVKTVQQLLPLDEGELKLMGLSPIQVAEIEAKIGTPRPGQYYDRTVGAAMGPAKLAALNGTGARNSALRNFETAYAQLVKEGARLYEVAVSFYDPLRRADQRVQNIDGGGSLRKVEVALQNLRRVWAETVANPPSADWLVSAQLDGHFASTPKAQRPVYEAVLAMGEDALRAAFAGHFSGEDAEALLAAKVTTALGQIAFAKKAAEVGLTLFEAAQLGDEELLAKGLAQPEVDLIRTRLAVVEAKKAEREAAVAAKAKAAQAPAPADTTSWLDCPNVGQEGCQGKRRPDRDLCARCAQKARQSAAPAAVPVDTTGWTDCPNKGQPDCQGQRRTDCELCARCAQKARRGSAPAPPTAQPTLVGAGDGKDEPAPAPAVEIEEVGLDNPAFHGFVVAMAERAGHSAEEVIEKLGGDPVALTAARAAYAKSLTSGNGKAKPDPKRKDKADGKAKAEAKNGDGKPARRSLLSRKRVPAAEAEE